MSSITNVYTSNNINKLTKLFANHLLIDPVSPFQKEIVLIQSASIEYYLSLELAKINNICAGINFIFVSNFIKNILELDKSFHFPFDKKIISWMLWQLFMTDKEFLKLLPENILLQLLNIKNYNGLNKINENIKTENFRNKTQLNFFKENKYNLNEINKNEININSLKYLTDLLSNLFERYTLNNFKITGWQGKIWETLLTNYYNNSELEKQNLNKIKNLYRFDELENLSKYFIQTETLSKLGKRIFVFGVDLDILDPFLKNILQKISNYISINCYLITPHANVKGLSIQSPAISGTNSGTLSGIGPAISGTSGETISPALSPALSGTISGTKSGTISGTISGTNSGTSPTISGTNSGTGELNKNENINYNNNYLLNKYNSIFIKSNIKDFSNNLSYDFSEELTSENSNKFYLNKNEFLTELFEANFPNSKISLTNSKINCLLDFIKFSLNTNLDISKLANDLNEINFLDSLIEIEYVDSKKKVPSFLIQNCHSTLREIEVLQDTIIALLNEENENISPEDILVICNDPENYSPLFKKIFDKKIPYKISYREQNEEESYVSCFFEILEILLSKFEISKVLSLISKKWIRENYNISINELDNIEKFLINLNFSWGVNKEHRTNILNNKNKLEEDIFINCNLQKVIENLFLSYCLDDFENLQNLSNNKIKNILNNKFFSNINLSNSELEVLEKISEIFEHLNYYYNQVQNKSLSEWETFFREIENVFLNKNDLKDNYDIEKKFDKSPLFEIFKDLHELEKNFNIIEKCDLDTLLNYLKENFNQNQKSHYFPGKGIHISNFNHSLYSPYKIIYILGMNDSSFPRTENKLEFDLFEGKYIEKSKKDRKLFLATLLSAEKNLIISYIGQSLYKSKEELQASIVVRELFQYLSFIPNIKNKILIKHFIQGFHPKYFEKNSKYFSYSQTQYKAAINTLNKENKDILFWNLKGNQNVIEDFESFENFKEFDDLEKNIEKSKKEKIEDNFKNNIIYYKNKNTSNNFLRININELINFYKNPIENWFRKNLNFSLIKENYENENLSSIELEKIANPNFLKLNYSILNGLTEIKIKFKDNFKKSELYNLVLKIYYLNNNNFTKIFFEKLWVQADNLIKNILNITSNENIINNLTRINLNFKNFIFLEGNFYNKIFNENNSLFFSFTNNLGPLKIKVWIRHLCLNINFGQHTTYLFTKSEFFKFIPIEKTKAQNYLLELLNLYVIGLSKPIMFFEKTSYEYFEKELKFPKNIWYTNDFTQSQLGESENIYNKLLFRGINLFDDFNNLSFKKISTTTIPNKVLQKNKSERKIYTNKKSNNETQNNFINNEKTNLYKEFDLLSQKIFAPLFENSEKEKY